MDPVFLNRLGIILNFLAGFMLAPELLGIERLKKAEIYIEKNLQYTKSILDKITNKTLSPVRHELNSVKSQYRSGQEYVGLLIWLLIYVTLFFRIAISWKSGWLISQAYHTPWLFVFVVILTAALAIAFHIAVTKAFALNVMDYIWLSAIDTFGFFVQIVLSTIIYFFIFIVGTILSLGNGMVSYIINRLEGQDRIRSVLIWWGIIFFILGNLLQFISTF